MDIGAVFKNLFHNQRRPAGTSLQHRRFIDRNVQRRINTDRIAAFNRAG